MPLHLGATPGPLEVELGLVVLDRGADEVGDDVADLGLGDVLPEHGVAVDRARDPAQARVRRGVVGLEIEHRVRLAHRPAGLDQAQRRRPELVEPVVADRPLEQDEAVLEIVFALALGQNARANRQDLLWSHVGCLR